MSLELIFHPPEIESHHPPRLVLHGAWHGAWCWEEYFLPYVEIIPDLAHDVMLEANWQMVAERMLAWLQERGL